jgi:putative inorganic carbon (hco3(-)) transporter
MIPEGLEIPIFGRVPVVSLFDISLIVIISLLIFRALFGNFIFDVGDKYVFWLCVSFVLAQLVTLLFSLRDVPRGFLAIKVFIFGYLCYLLCTSLIIGIGDIRKILLSLICWGAIVGVLLLYHYLTDWASIIGQKASYITKGEIGISMGRSNYLAALLVPIIPVAISILFSGSRKQRVLAGVCGSLILIGLVITMSKGAIGALGIGFVCSLPLLWKAGVKLKHVVICGVALGLLLVIGQLVAPDLLAFNYEMVVYRFSQPDLTRIDLWRTAWEVFLDHPLLGIGPNAIYIYNYQFVVEDLYSHNFILNSLAEMGIVGSIPFFLLLVTLIQRSYHLCISTLNNPKLKFMTVALFVGFISTLIHGMVEPTFQGQQYAAIFWIYVAIMYLLQRVADSSNETFAIS